MTKSSSKALAALAIAWLAFGCGGNPDKPARPSEPAEPADNCTVSEECDLVDACCGCNAGGRKLAIRKDAVAAFTASYQDRCRGQMCPQMISQHPSCDAEAVCGNRNRCRVAHAAPVNQRAESAARLPRISATVASSVARSNGLATNRRGSIGAPW